ncbi:MAG TPA: dTMP kinase [Ignavibacteria bacterium]
MFITFEGIDFSGKTTQAKLLYEYLKEKKKKVIFVREPGGTYISEKIREILLDKENHNMHFLTEFLLFSASRQQLVNEVIKPHLKREYIVICDRYYDSSTAYQGYGGNLDLKHVNNVNRIATDGLIPDITFLIDIDYNETLKRKKNKKNIDDRIEQKKKSYYRKVINGYREIAKKEKRFKVLNGKETVQKLQAEIIKILNNQKIHKK